MSIVCIEHIEQYVSMKVVGSSRLNPTKGR